MTDDYPLDTVFKRASAAIGAEVNGKTTLLQSERWQYLEFSPVGERIWRMLEEPRALSTMVEALVADFEVDPQTCRRDVQLFLRDMVEKGYIAKP